MLSNLPPLNTDTIWAILREEIDDATVNQLVWYYLGYRYDEQHKSWNSDNVAEDWQKTYPQPPDFIVNRPPTVKLTRSIPPENKQLLNKLGEFGPRQTRRATAASWLLSYIQTSC
jgi:Domain of unknown function (DUF1823)